MKILPPLKNFRHSMKTENLQQLRTIRSSDLSGRYGQIDFEPRLGRLVEFLAFISDPIRLPYASDT